jgi:hypothetical protein
MADLDAAKGGLVLDRLQSWAKSDPDKDDRTPMGTGQMGPQDAQDYGKKGAAHDDAAGDKCLSMSSLKKKNQENEGK